ncbi:MAG: hypothetical protein II972_03835 [Elusimicrobiaceae bacterium]|nr:hypothetical protein [Elusimicrobiaceae bacterium]
MFKNIIAPIKNNKGQQTIEFVLLLGVIVSAVLLFFSLFHKELAGGFFTIVGYVLT